MAASRRMAAARFAEGCVRLLSRRPPPTLVLGARVIHDVKCLSVGQRVMSVPTSERSRSALYGPMPSSWDRSTPVSWCSGVRTSKRGSLPRGFCRGGSGGRGSERLEMGLDGAVAGGDLLLIGVEELKVLLEYEHVFGAIVAGQGGDDLRLGCATPVVTMLGGRLRS